MILTPGADHLTGAQQTRRQGGHEAARVHSSRRGANRPDIKVSVRATARVTSRLGRVGTTVRRSEEAPAYVLLHMRMGVLTDMYI